jgi:N-methylhydantoinase A
LAIIGIDTGGTFTDLVLRDGARLVPLKVASTPDDPSRAVLEGVHRILQGHGGRRALTLVVHGSTVATNALLERKGARTALVTTRGFGDVLEIGRQARTDLYDLSAPKPVPLVPRDLVVEIEERIARKGGIESRISAPDLERLLTRLKKAGVESVAVGLLHSWSKGGPEKRVGRALARLGIPVTLSHEVAAEFREHERLGTAVVNAYVAPRMSLYLGTLERGLGRGRLRILHSAGGTLTARNASRLPVHTVLSGPAGGVVGALAVARRAGFTRVLTFDMGGTSTDVAAASASLPVVARRHLDGHPLLTPALDIHTVGAGGGSLARVDEGGALVVGPESAGADPGPVCYGRGGTSITTTDAHVFLGRILPDQFLGGAMLLHPEMVQGGMKELAKKLRCSPHRAALGILDVAESTMARALRLITVERGHDPADFTLVCFGGAGGLHAASLAARLRIPRVMVPLHPGLLSARGALLAAPEITVARTAFLTGPTFSRQEIEKAFAPLQEKARRALVREGVPDGNVRVQKTADVRYRGQSHELEIEVSPRGTLDRSFHRLHRIRFGHSRPGFPLELVTLRARASGPRPSLPAKKIRRGRNRPPASATLVQQRVAFPEGRLTTSFLRREELLAGNRVTGPAIIVEYSSTTVLPPGHSLRVDDHGNLLIERRRDG